MPAGFWKSDVSTVKTVQQIVQSPQSRFERTGPRRVVSRSFSMSMGAGCRGSAWNASEIRHARSGEKSNSEWQQSAPTHKSCAKTIPTANSTCQPGEARLNGHGLWQAIGGAVPRFSPGKYTSRESRYACNELNVQAYRSVLISIRAMCGRSRYAMIPKGGDTDLANRHVKAIGTHHQCRLT